jgi:serine/threonine-protein kinase HipA
MPDLVVELYGTRAGVLSGTWRTFDFLPDTAVVERFWRT